MSDIQKYLLFIGREFLSYVLVGLVTTGNFRTFKSQFIFLIDVIILSELF